MPEPTTPIPTAPQPNAEVETLKKQVAELTTKLAETSTFVQDASILVSAIVKNPELQKQVTAQIQQQYNPAPTPTPTPAPAPTPAPTTPDENQKMFQNSVENMDLKMRNDIVEEVERTLGYGELDTEKKKELRQNVEKRLMSMGTSIFKAPVNQLNTLLKDAYFLTDVGKAKEEGRLEGLVSAHQNNIGAFPSMTGATPKQEGVTMDEHHQTWTKKLDVNSDKVLENLKEFSETGKIVYKPPEKVTPTTPQPSGSPTPPVPQT